MRPFFLWILLMGPYNEARSQQRAAHSQAISHPFVLQGILSGDYSGYVYLNYFPDPAGSRAVMDSCRVTNGQFVFKGRITQPYRATLSTFNMFAGDQDQEANRVEWYLAPGSLKTSVRMGHFAESRLSGSLPDSERILLQQLLQPIRDRSRAISAKIETGVHSGANDSLYALSRLEETRYNAVDSAFIAQHPLSYVSVRELFGFSGTMMSFASYERLYNKMPERVRKSADGQRISGTIKREKELAIASPARNFTAIDHRGDTVRLSAYKGKKYVLLDFGASWCGPCRDLIPHLKEEYNRYSRDLEIISIANQKEVDDWRKTVEQDHLSWPQILENKQLLPIRPAGCTISDLYFVDEIPVLVLIDRDRQTIIGKWGGGSYTSRGTYECVKMLDELLAASSRGDVSNQ